MDILLQIRRGELEQLNGLSQFRRHHQFHALLLNQTITDLQSHLFHLRAFLAITDARVDYSLFFDLRKIGSDITCTVGAA